MGARLKGVIGAFRRPGGWSRLAAAFAAALWLGSAQGAIAGQGVINVRCGGDQTQTRMVIELDQSAKGRLIDAGADSRLVTLALPDTGVASDLQGHCPGLVTAWSMDSVAGAARLKVELSRQAQVRRRFLLPPSDGVSVYRYVIDLAATDAPQAASGASAPAVSGANQTARLQAASFRTLPAARLKLKKVVVIDAGHGGKDPGALGARTHEKDLTLAAAKALRSALLRTGRYKVVMTRDSDVFVPLETRVQIARHADADLFISLHADSGPDPSVRGATVYTLSDKGSDRVVRNVMAENDWFINVDMPGRDRAVNQILLDLTQRSTRNRSDTFAEDLISHVSAVGDVQMQHRSHRDAGYVVLLAPDVPAVLLEMGFITSPADEEMMSDPDARARFMAAVAASIDDYFGQQTRVAER